MERFKTCTPEAEELPEELTRQAEELIKWICSAEAVKALDKLVEEATREMLELIERGEACRL